MKSIRLFIWYLNAKLFLDCHHHLHRIQTVKTEIICEMSISSNLESINMVSTQRLAQNYSYF